MSILDFRRLPQATTIITGPPGTGKTYELLQRILRLVSRHPLHRIGVVTFTRAATHEMRERIERQLHPADSDMARIATIHATSFRLLRDAGLDAADRLLDDDQLQEFAQAHGYRLSRIQDPDVHEAPGETLRQTDDDSLLYVHGYARSAMLGLEAAIIQSRVRVDPAQLRLFTNRYDQYKEENELLDFSDMLYDVLEHGLCPDIDILLVDEAQDLSPLQIMVVHQWAAGCQLLIIAGDDDQAIYSFQGASPVWFVGLQEAYPRTLLTQSHRVPECVHALAEAIIAGNRDRAAKVYQPRRTPGEVTWIDLSEIRQFIDPDRSTFVLARTRMMLVPVVRDLFEHHVPFYVEFAGTINPLQATFPPRMAVWAATQLSAGGPVKASEFRCLLRYVGEDVGLSRDAVAALLECVEKNRARVTPAKISGWGAGAILEAIEERGPIEVLGRMRYRYRSYYSAMLERYGEIPEEMQIKIRLSTIHKSKGREAHTVVLLTSLSGSSYEEYCDQLHGGHEAETRLLYVAVTRARERLLLVRPRGRKHYEVPR